MKHYARKVITMLMVCVLAFCTMIIPDTLEAKKIQLAPEAIAQQLLDSQNTLAEAKFKSGGATHTHQYIVTQALNILRRDKGACILHNLGNVSYLKEYTDWPDKVGNETDFATYQGHFYNPYTGKNFAGSTSKTALARALNYLDEAVIAYRSGNIADAIMNLGKGTHYVSDLNEPHHAANLIAFNSNHSAFEKYVDQNYNSFYISGNSLDASYYTDARSQTVTKMLKDAAFYAYDLQYMAQDESSYFEAANLCVQHAITCVTQYLYRFGYEVGIYTR